MVARVINETLMEVEHTPPVHKRILDVLPGMSGGVARVMVGQPFDTIKTRLQVLGKGTALAATMPPEFVYTNSMDCVKKMVKHEGAMSMYKGAVAPLLGNMVLLGIHFPVFTKTLKNLTEGDAPGSFSTSKVIMAGAAAGGAGSFVSAPVELIRTKMQMQRRAALASKVGASASASASAESYKGSMDCFAKVLKHHGIKGLYRGFSSTVARDMVGYAGFFLGYEYTIHKFLENAGPGVHTKGDLNYLQVMAAGVVAGFGLWGSMFPIDTIKSKLQADSLANPTYKNTMDCLSQTLKQEGAKGLFRGFEAAMYRAIPVNAAIFLAVEGSRKGISIVEDYMVEQKVGSAAAV